jgi:hypothetical protein
MKVHKNTDDLHKEISELKDTLEGFKKLVEVQRKEIFDLKKYVSEDIKNKNLLQGYRKVVEEAEALGPCSSKLVERNIYMYPGSKILELEACGLKLEPLCLGLEACSSLLSRLGA